ncbi:coniferyl aldehyde dehydrogenase [Shewanella sp. SR44-3]|uniref:coniferyl aldehyde dehydrogenase n=1 Tax=Shewanella sp. SR44-3 TaxID=2760936 RepID=UPI0015F9E4A6|nr:coniferyl aldehyde dehydrogenase [Shewanella sp. SR44-3]MBB1270039.1 coniferyl aldehyde dehydrogenase [Shewanella sp. SR44-3]
MNVAIDSAASINTMQATFNEQLTQFNAAPSPNYELRVAKLTKLKQQIVKHQTQLIEALKRDYGHRSHHDSLISDILPCINHINYSLKQLKSWMRPSRRHAGLLLSPASVSVQYQPLGVIGIIVPWNFPIMLSMGPLVTALAAGNNAMLKMSEFTPETNQVIRQLLAEIFATTEVAIVEGEADVAAAFSSLPFNHLLFTGSTQVGRHVMRAAAENLTPVTLELGGKSPTIIADDMPIELAVERMIYGKCLNAGQICVAPDYVLCPKAKLESFIQAYSNHFQKMYPDFEHNQDYGNIINARQQQRLQAVLEDAKAKGATITPAAPSSSISKLATQLITNVTPDMAVMQTEIFGPLLPIIPYGTLDEAINYIKAHDRPLALYIMSLDSKVQQHILAQTHSGGVSINETVLHVAADDAPFGGIGPSGMGHYHGKEGFLTFSHAKTVLKSGRFSTSRLVHPPYGNKLQALLLKFFLR